MRKYLVIVIILCCFLSAYGQFVPFSPQQFNDETWRVFDNGDPTKRVEFELSGLTTSTTRTLTIPDASGTIALTSDLTTGYVPYTGANANLNMGVYSSRFDGGVGIGIAAPTGALSISLSTDTPLTLISSSTVTTEIRLDNTGGGDVDLGFYIGGMGKWFVGVDNTASDSFVIGQSIFGSADNLVISPVGNFDFKGGRLTITGNIIGGGSGHDQFSDFVGNEHFDTSTLTAGSVIISDGTTFVEDNVGLFFATSTNRLGIGTNVPDKSLEMRNASPVIRLRDTGATADATTAFIEFGGTDAGNWVRTGWVGDGSSGSTDISLRADIGDLLLADSSGVNVTLSGGDATFAGTINIGASGKINFRDTDISIGSTLTDGILDITADFSIDMFFDNADVGAEADGQSLNINRRAVEGDDYISLYVNKDKKGLIGFSGDDDLLELAANALTVNGTMGVGVAAASDKRLNVEHGTSATSGNQTALYFNLNTFPGSASTANYRAITGVANYNGNTADMSGYITVLRANPFLLRGGSVTGRMSIIDMGSSGLFTGSTGDIADLYYIYGEAPIADGSGTITNAAYIYLNDIGSAATNNWAIYSAGGDSFHAGDLAFGQTDKAERIGSDADGTLDLYAGTSIDLHGGVIVPTINGVDYTPGSDTDTDLITVNVTGTPKLWWDEATDSFEMNKNLTLPGVLHLFEITTPTAITNHGAIYTKNDNELYFQDGAGTEHLIHGDAFSNIWYHGISTVEVTISTQNVYTKIDSFTVVGKEDDLGHCVGSTANNEIVLNADAGGEYEVSYHASITATGGADKEMLVCLGIELATKLDITNVTDDTVTPIVITSTAHDLEDGDMVEIAVVLVNTAANGSFVVDGKTADTFKIVKLDGSATTGNGDYDEGTPTGDVTILYPGNMVVHRVVRGADAGSISATGIHDVSNSDKLAVYVANLDGTTNLTVDAISFDAFRIGD
ncbi:hypothetical protein LCGC14_0421400 [marine sediment metagenome]|uniref:Uncharacterized protein n=1 Tax=marine sediment metagenome TaxID=412755 RepID=A0A0F9W045_9ZZZZ